MGKSYVSKAVGAVEEWDSVQISLSSVSLEGQPETSASVNGTSIYISHGDKAWGDYIVQLYVYFKADGTVESVGVSNHPSSIKDVEIVSFSGTAQEFHYHVRCNRMSGGTVVRTHNITVTGKGHGKITRTRVENF